MSLKKILVFICFISFNTPLAAKNNLNVLLINPSIKNDPFWHQVEELTKKAAKDLDIKLDVIYGNGNRFLQIQELKNYLSHNEIPQYIMLVNYPGGALNTFEFLEKYAVKIITLEQTISGKEKKEIGMPRGKYKNWVAEIYHDNKKASQLLASSLFEKAKNKGKPLVVAGVSGHFGSESAIRNSGLLSMSEEYKADLKQIVYAQWSRENAYEKTFKLLKRYPDISVIWCASDEMALGVINAVKRMGFIPGEDIFIGGFDWIQSALLSIKQNEMSASVGGHFMMGVWALVSLYDNENGRVRFKDQSIDESTFDLELIEDINISTYSALLDQSSLMKVDFKKLSLFHNPNKKEYNFKLLEILNSLEFNKTKKRP